MGSWGASLSTCCFKSRGRVKCRVGGSVEGAQNLTKPRQGALHKARRKGI